MIKLGIGILIAVFGFGGFYISSLQEENRELLTKQGEL